MWIPKPSSKVLSVMDDPSSVELVCGVEGSIAGETDLETTITSTTIDQTQYTVRTRPSRWLTA